MRVWVLVLGLLAAPMGAWAQQTASVVATGSEGAFVTFVIVTKEGEIKYCVAEVGYLEVPRCTTLAQ